MDLAHVNTKCCEQCKEDKNLDDFYKRTRKSGKAYYCTKCKKCSKNNSIKKYDDNKDKIRKVQKEYKDRNKDYINSIQLKYRLNNKAKTKERNTNNYFKKLGKHDKIITNTYEKSEIAVLRETRKKNKKMIQEQNNSLIEKCKQNVKNSLTDIERKIVKNLRQRIRSAITNKKNGSKELLGCDVSFFKSWLETQFDSHMNWDNYCSYWHVDHVKPCATFCLEDVIEQKKCFNWKNCKPLEKIKNITKRNKQTNFEILMQELRVTHYLRHNQIAGTPLAP